MEKQEKWKSKGAGSEVEEGIEVETTEEGMRRKRKGKEVQEEKKKKGFRVSFSPRLALRASQLARCTSDF